MNTPTLPSFTKMPSEAELDSDIEFMLDGQFCLCWTERAQAQEGKA